MTPASQNDATKERYTAGATPVEFPRRASQPLLPLAAIYQNHAAANLRRHLWRPARRILTLVALDIGAYWMLGAALDYARTMSGKFGAVVTDMVPPGFLGGFQFVVALTVSLAVLGNYGPGDERRSLRRVFLASCLATALPLWAHLWGAPLLVLGQFALVVASVTAMVFLMRRLCDWMIWRFLPRTRSRVVLIGPAAACMEMLSRTDFADREAMQFVGFVDTDASDSTGATIRALSLMLAEHCADTVMLCGHVDEAQFAAVVRAASTAEAQVLATARSYEQAGIAPSVVWRNGSPFIELRAMTLRGQQLVLKRLLDIVLSLAALLLLAPVAAFVALLVKMNSAGPAVFGQPRLGRHGRAFRCYKFRSMYTDAEARLKSDAALYARYVANDFKLPPELDTRVTPVGRFLRRTSLDEIPQLWNVLRGDMSLVGPRPIVPAEIEHYRDQAPMLLLLKPGITGSWQVSGRSACNYPERTDIELEYVQSWSLVRDLSILLRTVPAVLLQRGAH